MTNHDKIVDFFEKTVNVDYQNLFADELYDVIRASNQPSYVIMHAIGVIAALYLSRYQDPDDQLECFIRLIKSEIDEFSKVVST